MKRFPFSPEGVAAMCQYYDQLADTEFITAAARPGQDFTGWLQQHFELAESQLTYLQKIAPAVLAFMAANVAFALGNRLPIILAKQGKMAAEASESKLTKPKSNLAATILPDGSFRASGEFVIEITYK